MAEQNLYYVNVVATAEQGRGEWMAQGVRRGGFAIPACPAARLKAR